MDGPGSVLGSARLSRALPNRIPVGAIAIQISDTAPPGANRVRADLSALLSYSPESIDYFGAALLELAMMNCGQTREEQRAGLG